MGTASLFPRRRRSLWTWFVFAYSVYMVLAFASILRISVRHREPTRRLSTRSSLMLFYPRDKDESMYATCKYEGHCAVGFTCVKSKKSVQGGICRPYKDDYAALLPFQGEDLDECVEQCLHHVVWNEQFYWEASPNVTSAEHASYDHRRPPGCLIRYSRNLDQAWPDFSFDKWQNMTKDKRIVRVDPVGEAAKTAKEQEWVSFCYKPCQTDADCGASDAFACMNTTCRRRVDYWNRTDDPQQAEMVIVSGSSSGYIRGLKNLAGSIQHWAPNHRLVVYNLGMTQQQIAEIESWDVVLEVKWKDGFPKHFPRHVHEGKIYAWKPLAINESLHEYHNIFWLDAGSTLVGPLDEIERILQETGMFLVKGQDLDMKLKSSPITYRYFGQNKSEFHAGPHFGGNTQAHIYPSRYIDTIVRPNAACAMDVNCIAPNRTSLFNHRYDQTVLSILSYMPGIQAPHHTQYLAGSREQLSKDLHQSSGRFIIWTARQAAKDFLGDVTVKRGKSVSFSGNSTMVEAAAKQKRQTYPSAREKRPDTSLQQQDGLRKKILLTNETSKVSK